jgi:citrate synthase
LHVAAAATTSTIRGYDILDIADVCEFEEIAHLLVHGKAADDRRARGL